MHHPRTEEHANRIARQQLRDLEKQWGTKGREIRSVVENRVVVDNSRSISLTEAKLRTEVLMSEAD